MARDYMTEIDKLGRQLADLRAAFAPQAGDAADDAARYVAPHARHLASQLQREAPRLATAARRNPSAATGAMVGAMVLGAAFVWLLSAGGSRDGS